MEENADEDEEDLSPQSAEESWTDTGTILTTYHQADGDTRSHCLMCCQFLHSILLFKQDWIDSRLINNKHHKERQPQLRHNHNINNLNNSHNNKHNSHTNSQRNNNQQLRGRQCI